MASMLEQEPMSEPQEGSTSMNVGVFQPVSIEPAVQGTILPKSDQVMFEVPMDTPRSDEPMAGFHEYHFEGIDMFPAMLK